MIFNKLVFLKTFIASYLKTDYMLVLLLNNKLGSCHSKSVLAFVGKMKKDTCLVLRSTAIKVDTYHTGKQPTSCRNTKKIIYC